MTEQKPKRRVQIALPPLAVGVAAAAAMCGLSRSGFYAAWSAGKTPEGHVIGKRRIFPVRELEFWVELGMPSREKFQQLKATASR